MDKEPNINNPGKIMTEEQFIKSLLSGDCNFWIIFSSDPEYKADIKKFLQENYSEDYKYIVKKFAESPSGDLNAPLEIYKEDGPVMYKLYKALKSIGFEDNRLGIVEGNQ
jgi:hypothetical protein